LSKVVVDAPPSGVSTNFVRNLTLPSLSLEQELNKTKKTERNKNILIECFMGVGDISLLQIGRVNLKNKFCLAN
jgi:hypothetical protein